jgi:hypothetical protein
LDWKTIPRELQPIAAGMAKSAVGGIEKGAIVANRSPIVGPPKATRLAPKGKLGPAGARATAAIAPRSPAKPGLGTASNIGLGILISLAEASIGNEIYRNGAAALNDLLRQIDQNNEATEKDWLEINQELQRIASMKQSYLGYLFEFLTYGQGSLPEKQGGEMYLLALRLAERFGYANVRTLNDILSGDFGTFKKAQGK